MSASQSGRNDLHVTSRWRQIPESALMTWWFQRAASESELRTEAGEQIIILDPGTLNDGPGPDIVDAVIALDGRIESGAVEMHRHAHDWFHHGHDKDEAYQSVILHVVSRVTSGPAIPTLVVGQHRNTDWCIARRELTYRELFLAATDRYREKRNKIQRWQQAVQTSWPVINLGLLDTITYGPYRKKLWQYVRHKYDLFIPLPDTPWRGSRRSRINSGVQIQRVERLIADLPALIPPNLDLIGWSAWEGWWRYNFRLWRIPVTLLREWLINWVIPDTYPEPNEGLALWQQVPLARHYGVEQRMGAYTGWSQVRSALEQQGLLYWWQNGCKPQRCQICPLTKLTVSENLYNTLYDKRLANSSLVNCE